MWMQVMLCAGLPALLVTLLLVGRWGWRAQSLALVATAVAVSFVFGEPPQWPWRIGPGDGGGWLLWSVVGGGSLGALRDLRIVPPRLGDALAWAGLVAFGWFVIRGLRQQHDWEVQLLALGAGGLVLGLVYASLRAAVAQDAGAGAGIGAVAMLLGDALVAGSPILFVVAMVIATATIVGCWRPPARLGEGASLAVAAGHGAVPLLWLGGDGPSRITLLETLLLGLGPVLLLLALRKVVVRKRSFGSPLLVALGALCWTLIVFGFVNRPNLL